MCRYRVDLDLEMLNSAVYTRIQRCMESAVMQFITALALIPPLTLTAALAGSTQAPYILLSNYRYIHKLSLDGSRIRTVISEPNQRIYTVDYHNRYTWMSIIYQFEGVANKDIIANNDHCACYFIYFIIMHAC